MADQIPDSTKLLPCPNPWCDCPDSLFVQPLNNRTLFGVQCCCGFEGPVVDDERRAIAAWNTRAAPPAMDREAVLEALELADATLRGANMDRAFVERKVTAAITGLKSTSTVPADTMVILHALLTEYAGQPNQAGEAYKLVDATLSADAIRQGEGATTANSPVVPADRLERLKMVEKDLRDYCVGLSGNTVKMPKSSALLLACDLAEAISYIATPASHASDGGKA